MRISTALPFVALAATAVVAGIAGCGGSSVYTASTPSPVVTPTGACAFPTGETAQMLFPVNGGIGVANLQGLVFAVSPSPLPTNWYVYATVGGKANADGSLPAGVTSTQNTSSTAFLATPSPSPSPGSATPTPLPTPSSTPLASSYVFETASIGTFATNTQFEIYLANQNCAIGLDMGGFTTATVDTPTPTPSPTST